MVFITVSFFSSKDVIKKEQPTQNQQNVLYVSEGTLVHHLDQISSGNVATSSKDVSNPEIYLTNGANVYGAEVFNDVKIVKLPSEKKSNVLKVVEEKTKIANKIKKRKFITKKAVAYLSDTGDRSNIFSGHENLKFVFIQDRTETFSKTLVSFFSISKTHIDRGEKDSVIYQNPSITTFQFSGKHSVRPPTLFS